jgi:hypothetical protein
MDPLPYAPVKMFAHQYWIESKTTQIRRILYMPADRNEYIYKEMDVTLIPHQRVFNIEDSYLLYTNFQYTTPARNVACRKLGFRLAFGDTYMIRRDKKDRDMLLDIQHDDLHKELPCLFALDLAKLREFNKNATGVEELVRYALDSDSESDEVPI